MFHPIIICFTLLAFLHFLEGMGFFFRSSGVIADNLVAGYTLQSSLGFLSRILGLGFTPLFAYLADTRQIDIGLSPVFYYYFVLIALMAINMAGEKIFPVTFAHIVNHVSKGRSIFYAIRKTSIVFPVINTSIKAFNVASLFRLVLQAFCETTAGLLVGSNRKYYAIIAIFAISYVPFYACWPLICYLIVKFPDKPATFIALSTFFTMASSVFQSLVFDPWMSSLSSSADELSSSISLLIKLKFGAVLTAMILTLPLFLILDHFR